MDILRTLEHLLGDVLDEKRDANGEPLPPLLPTVLLGIRARLGELTSLQLEPTGNGLESWLEKVRSLTGTPETRETMAVRLLQLKLPRVAETLALAGAITMPQGAPDGAISLVALIGVRLPPPGIQLGFGFAVSGFGGLIGINRRADLDKLREKLASGSKGDVQFTQYHTQMRLLTLTRAHGLFQPLVARLLTESQYPARHHDRHPERGADRSHLTNERVDHLGGVM